MRRHNDRNRAFYGFVVSLALVTVMVGVKNRVNFADTQARQVVQNSSRAEVNQQASATITH